MKERPGPRFPVAPVIENGPPSVKVDIVVVGDGYAAADMEKFRKDVRRFVDTMFRTHPFRERKNDFNVWRIDVVSEESGIDIPDRNVWKNNALGTKYNTFGLPALRADGREQDRCATSLPPPRMISSAFS
jgi:hypothetical protein